MVALSGLSSAITLVPPFKPMSRSILLLVALSVTLSATAQDWPRFRGPNGSGLGVANLPAQWTPANHKWTAKLPGVGHGSPVVWGDRIFLLCGNEGTGRRTAACLNAADGRLLWQHDFDALASKQHRLNSMASSTPAVDPEHVYFTWGTAEKLTVIAFTHAGKTVWEADLGPVKRQHGFGASPLLHDDLVILSNDQERDSHLFALDRATGKVRWKLPRAENHSNYSTPCIYTPPGGKPQVVVVSWRLGATGVDAATGKQLWQLPLFAQKQERAIGSPSVAGEYLIVKCAFTGGPKHVVVLKPGKEPGTMLEAWRMENTVPHIPSPSSSATVLTCGGIRHRHLCPAGDGCKRRLKSETGSRM